jgi:predicted metal-dependent phosphoesterase TrpH
LTTMRADLHVHTWASAQSGSMRFLRSRDCYSSPFDVYDTARARGMDVVTITDHDSIDGCLEFLDRHPDAADFIVGEEVECFYPLSAKQQRAHGPLRIHVGVLGLNERQHRELQPFRRDVFELVQYLRSQDLFFAINHLFFFFRRQVPLDEYVGRMLALFSALEARNGAMLEAQNSLISRLCDEAARDRGVPYVFTGGSDAHTLRAVGTTWTSVECSTRDEFLAGLRAGGGVVGGAHGSVTRVAAEIYGVIARYVATLAGAGRCDLGAWHRAGAGAFACVAMPFQFIPGLIAMGQKAGEARRVRDWELHG